MHSNLIGKSVSIEHSIPVAFTDNISCAILLKLSGRLTWAEISQKLKITKSEIDARLASRSGHAKVHR